MERTAEGREIASTFPARNPVPRRHSIVCAIKYLATPRHFQQLPDIILSRFLPTSIGQSKERHDHREAYVRTMVSIDPFPTSLIALPELMAKPNSLLLFLVEIPIRQLGNPVSLRGNPVIFQRVVEINKFAGGLRTATTFANLSKTNNMPVVMIAGSCLKIAWKGSAIIVPL